MDTSGRKAVPQSVLQYTPILQILKRALLLIKQEMPNDEQYQRAYNYTLKAERYHTNYIYSQKSQFPENYSPFDSIELTNIVAAISHACRAQAFMSVCGVIEGNAWLNGQERIYLSDRLGQGLNYFVTPEARNDKCKKAVNAHAGGVISSNMRSYFCEAGD